MIRDGDREMGCRVLRVAFALLVFVGCCAGVRAQTQSQGGIPTANRPSANWHRFRGPGGSGISDLRSIPTEFNGDTGEGILWKTAAPLPGKSSPVVWGDRVFLTGAEEGKQEVYCFDADDGRLLWKRDVPVTPLSEEQLDRLTDFTGFAAPTAACDGRLVYAMFATGDVVAFDLQGNRRWLRPLGAPNNRYGHAASLAIEKDLLLVQFDQGSREEKLSKLIALNSASGETAWSAPRPVPNSWPTPIIIEHEGRRQIVTAADPWVIAYSPGDGKELWRANCLEGDIGPSPVFAGGVVYVVSEFPAMTAIRADGQGDVTDTHILWRNEDSLPDCASPLATEEFVLMLASFGTLTCCDAKKGDILWQEDFDGAFTSSPSMAGGRLYLLDEDGQVWIVEPSREKCRRIAQTTLGEPCFSSPAFVDGRIYVRGEDHLICIGRPR